MQCPICKVENDRVVDSRLIGEGNAIRRRRQCLKCRRRFTTYERIETAPRMVVKKDLRRELFSRGKILNGMMRACEKRNISVEQLESLVSKIESEIFEECDSEVSSRIIGEKVSESLRVLDQVAFVRFASVYREFTDAHQFLQALAPLIGQDPAPAVPGRVSETLGVADARHRDVVGGNGTGRTASGPR